MVLQSWLLKFIQKQPKVNVQRLFLYSPIFNIFSSVSKSLQGLKDLGSSLCDSRDTGGLCELSVNEEGILSSPKDFELAH